MLKMKINKPKALNLNYGSGSAIIVDEFPRENSKNAVSSGGVYQSLKDLDNKIDNIDLSEYAKKEYVDKSIENSLTQITSFKYEIVDELPIENISLSTIYLILSEKSEEINIYDEYIYVNNNWELIGTTKIDLTNYYTKDEVDETIQNAKIEVDLSNYYTKEELNEELDNKVETSVDDKLGDIDTILTEIVGSTLEVDNKEY